MRNPCIRLCQFEKLRTGANSGGIGRDGRWRRPARSRASLVSRRRSRAPGSRRSPRPPPRRQPVSRPAFRDASTLVALPATDGSHGPHFSWAEFQAYRYGATAFQDMPCAASRASVLPLRERPCATSCPIAVAARFARSPGRRVAARSEAHVVKPAASGSLVDPVLLLTRPPSSSSTEADNFHQARGTQHSIGSNH